MRHSTAVSGIHTGEERASEGARVLQAAMVAAQGQPDVIARPPGGSKTAGKAG